MGVSVELRHNPYKLETVLKIDGDETKLKCFGDEGKDHRLQEWIDDFFDQVADVCSLRNGDECSLSFFGTTTDYEDMELAHASFTKKHPGIKIELKQENTDPKPTEEKLKELKKLFDEMQAESPYEELKTDDIKKGFSEAINSEFEMAVVATMSSGKSTFINALLGQELLPARNEATTATIARITDSDGTQGFTAQSFDETGKILKKKQIATKNILEEMNGDPQTDTIKIEGKIPEINSKTMKVVLLDTPGTNREGTKGEQHKVKTYELLEKSYKPLIMYILNAQQLQTNEVQNLLIDVAKKMKKSGKRSRDQFLFIFNKADVFDTERESVLKKTRELQDYLAKEPYRIEDPRIFPVSGQLAKLIRMNKNGCRLTETQSKALKDYKRFIDEKMNLHLSEFALLSQSCKKIQDEMLQKAIKNGDEYAQALIYSGIPAVELTINEYLDKYAAAAKAVQAFNVFSGKIKALQLEEKTDKKLSADDAKREKALQELKQLEELMKKGDKGKEFAQNLGSYIAKCLEELRNDLNEIRDEVETFRSEIYKEWYENDELRIEAAKELFKKTNSRITEECARLEPKLHHILNEKISKQAEIYLTQYREYIKGLLKVDEFSGSSSFNLIQIAIPDNPNQLLQQFAKSRKEKNPERSLSNQWDWEYEYTVGSWLKSIFVAPAKAIWANLTQDEYITRQYIQTKEFVEQNIQDVLLGFDKAINSCEEHGQQEAGKFFEFFQNKLKKLEEEMEAMIIKQKEKNKTRESLEKSISENKEKRAWLDKFTQKLDTALEV
jgi:GTPase Era involved in 16S rRNA processing